MENRKLTMDDIDHSKLIGVPFEGYAIFLDDIRYPTHEWLSHCPECRGYGSMRWTIARSYDEFIKVLEEKGIPTFVSYDHDLHDEHYDESMWKGLTDYEEAAKRFTQPTGLECAAYLISKLGPHEKHPPYFAHTQNPPGKLRIDNLIREHDNAIFEKITRVDKI